MGWAEEGDGESMVEGVDRMEGLMIVEDSIHRRDAGKGLGKGRSSGNSVGGYGSIFFGNLFLPKKKAFLRP